VLTKSQNDGVTKARLMANLDRVRDGQDLHESNETYLAYVCAQVGLDSFPTEVADDYARVWADFSVKELEAGVAGALASRGLTAKRDEILAAQAQP